MRRVLGILLLSEVVGFVSAADQPTLSGQAKQDILKQLEGNWVLKSASVSTPAGVGMANLDSPNTPKMALQIKDGYQIMLSDGKPSSTQPPKLELGREAECLYVLGKPGQKPFKVRFKLEGNTLVMVQDMLFQEVCPESFDPEKGRDRGRRVLTLTRLPQKP
ncbi:MAG TPA: hypothetical protein VGE74_04610 [Gemmata sp.]